jgi:hypothetical protein
MKRSALALTIIWVLLLSLIGGTMLVNSVNANFVPYPAEPNKDAPTLKVQTPQDGGIYKVNTLEVNFTVTKPGSWLYEGKTLYYWAGFPIVGTYSVEISIDGKQLNHPYLSDPRIDNGIDNLAANFSVVLKELTRGGHSVRIDVMATTFYNPNYPNHPSGGAASNYDMANVSKTVHFVVNADPPRILVLSPANENYSSTDIPLDLYVDRPVSQLTYSLDGHDNVAIDGNTTLTGLYYGVHFLAMHVTDTSGNTETSETIIFRVTEPEPFPTTLVVASIGSVAIVGLGLLVYLKKRQKGSMDKGVKLES